MVEIARTVESLRFNEFPEEVELMLEQRNWGDFLNRLRVGVVLTFSILEVRDQTYVKYTVDELQNGEEVFLIRPAWLNKGYDFKVCVEGWNSSANPAPSHSEVYSDLYWKREKDGEEAFDAISSAVMDIHSGSSPREVIEAYGEDFDFSVGRRPDALLRPLPWLFIEQDIRYWNYDGRNMTIETVQELSEDTPISDMDLEPQELDFIHSTELSVV